MAEREDTHISMSSTDCECLTLENATLESEYHSESLSGTELTLLFRRNRCWIFVKDSFRRSLSCQIWSIACYMPMTHRSKFWTLLRQYADGRVSQTSKNRFGNQNGSDICSYGQERRLFRCHFWYKVLQNLDRSACKRLMNVGLGLD